MSQPTIALSPPPPSVAARLLVCAGIFVVLVTWLLLFPYTDGGDSIAHFRNAIDTAATPVAGLKAWARPGFKLPLSLVAPHGIIAARIFMAGISVFLIWETMGLAKDLGIRQPLLAGVMLLWQPYAFSLASDTMTEMPMALGLVIAVRLWMRRGWRWLSCLVVGFLPAVRPEGFFMGPVWGVMVLFDMGGWDSPQCEAASGETIARKLARRVGLWALLSVGLVVWVGACVIWAGNWRYVLDEWSWPANGQYTRGPVLHYVINFPAYAGVPMTILFLAGVLPSLRRGEWRRTWLIWVIWLVVFLLHMALFWRGWFASCGLLRILAATSPFTAVVCLYGWNTVGDWIASRNGSRHRMRSIFAPRFYAVLAAVVCTAAVVSAYLQYPSHFECFPIGRCAAFIREKNLLRSGQWFFTANDIVLAELKFPGNAPNVMTSSWDPDEYAACLRKLPIGSIGVWDNRQGQYWHKFSIEDLAADGFTVLYDTHTAARDAGDWYWFNGYGVDLHFAVLRKDWAGPVRRPWVK